MPRVLPASLNTAVQKVSVVVFFSSVLFAFVASTHYALVQYLKRRGISLPMLTFPKIELTFLFFIIPAISSAAATCFQSGTRSDVAVGVFLLLLVPIPLLSWSIYTLYRVLVR